MRLLPSDRVGNYVVALAQANATTLLLSQTRQHNYAVAIAPKFFAAVLCPAEG